MTSSQYDEELLSSIASPSPPLSLKSGTLALPNLVSDPTTSELIPTPEPELSDIQPCSATQTSTKYTQPLSSTLKAHHSPIPPTTNLQVTIYKYTIPQKKINITL